MVPDRETGRKDGFVVPKQYKQSVMEELSSGCITHVTRRAIVQDVAAIICLNYTLLYTKQLDVIASKIAITFPVLADKLGTGHISLIFTTCVLV